jgi:amidase
VDLLTESQIKLLQDMGATIVDPVSMPTWKELGPAAGEVMLYEFKAGVNDYLAGQSDDVRVRTLADVIAFNEQHPELEKLSFLGQSVLLEAQSKGTLQDDAYRQALAQVKRVADLDLVFEEHRLDAILGPTNGPAWTIDLVNGDHFEGGSASAAAVGGYPHITVPAGAIHELPVGLSMIGPKRSERRLMSLAYDYEQASRNRREPRLLDTLRLD